MTDSSTKPADPQSKVKDIQAKKKETAQKFDQIRKDYKASLKPEEYPGTLSLIYDLDVPVCVITNDHQTWIGELHSYDTFGNIILGKARNRFIQPNGVTDSSFGVCYFRSEQIMLIGQVDKTKENEIFERFKITPPPSQDDDA